MKQDRVLFTIKSSLHSKRSRGLRSNLVVAYNNNLANHPKMTD